MQRIRMRVSFSNPQSFKPLQMTTIERHRIPVGEIWTLVSDMKAANVRLMALLADWERAHPKQP